MRGMRVHIRKTNPPPRSPLAITKDSSPNIVIVLAVEIAISLIK
jgi:hypothetical protein